MGWLKRLLRYAGDALEGMGLAKKLMLVYSVILGVAIVIFAAQLINAANEALEQSMITDTQSLLKESVYSIQREMDTCYQSINSISSDYDIISYIKDWNPAQPADIVEFNLTLKKRESLVRSLSPDVYQLRMYVHNPEFPEISSLIYSDTRLANLQEISDRVLLNAAGYWTLNQTERNYTTVIKDRKNVVALFRSITFSKNQPLGLMEVTVLTEDFFRHLLSQEQNENLLAFVMDSNGALIYAQNSEFLSRYRVDSESLRNMMSSAEEYLRLQPIKVTHSGVPMTLMYDYIEALDSYVCYVVAYDNATISITQTRNLIIIESLVAVALSSVLIYLFTGMLLRRMKVIIASMRKVEQGQIDARVKLSGHDEMSELAYHFNRMLGRLGDLIGEVVAKQESKKDAETRMLFSQINTHFIINSLQTIGMMSEIHGNLDAADAISALGRLLRYGMKWTEAQVRLKDELAYIKNYIALMNIRHEHVIRLDIDAPPELLDCGMIKMTLQPAVENSIHYGMEPLGRGGCIFIRARREDNQLIITVEDDGAGMSPDRLAEVRSALREQTELDTRGNEGHGIGIKNVNERIRMVYGRSYGIDIENRPDGGVRVSIRLPAQ